MKSKGSQHPQAAIVLSAGYGKRMRPLTATTPKPLINVAGKSMLQRAIDTLKEAQIKKCVVNVHYLADLVEIHASKATGIKIEISDERDELLETGGGIKKALPQLGQEPFVVMNSDSFWLEGVKPNLTALFEAWKPEYMDVLLLMAAAVDAVGYEGRGDYELDKQGGLTSRDERAVAPYIYSGIAIMKPELFANTPDGGFSLKQVFDQAEAKKRLYGVEGDGTWLHVGTPEGLEEAERAITLSAA
ncbi:nucleotidyltransferase family protein [Polycladidibacter stylochi]|uniref:nucleotidyltransferase family protein n=1 Tax=Polycladidibacter stylochi TaxID=1807766 RepID=UPI00082C50D0|nr:nucleotidyltransferase family protein [Pseudovibrio stylochi]